MTLSQQYEGVTKRPDSLSGFTLVSKPLICITTRVKFRHWWDTVWAYRQFRKVARESKDVDGLEHTTMLFEGLRTILTMSFWSREEAILKFNEGSEHAVAVRGAFGRAFKNADTVEICSFEWNI